MSHPQKHPLAGQTVRVKSPRTSLKDAPFRVVDWWDRLSDTSWKESGRKLCTHYVQRHGLLKSLPDDNEVVLGRIDSGVYLIHASEVGEVIS